MIGFNKARTLTAIAATLGLLAGLSLASTAAGQTDGSLAVGLKAPFSLLSKLSSSSKSEVIRPATGVTLRVAPGTSVTRMPNTHLLLSGSGQRTPTSVFRVLNGRVDVDLDEGGKAAVLLIGKTGESAIATGGHSAMVAGHSTLSFASFDTAMLVGKGNSWSSLAAGWTRTFDLKNNTTENRQRLGAPVVKLRSSLGIALAGSPFTANVSVAPVKGASAYEFLLLREDKGTFVPVAHSESRSPSASLMGDGPGAYQVVARAHDADGLEGPSSRPAGLTILGAVPPPGATIQGTTVRMNPRQRLTMLGTDGLLMSYGSGDYFVAAPETVGMSRGKPTLVRFRHPNSGGEVQVKLVPQTLEARVDIGPRRATWPRDNVTASILLVNERGKPVDAPERYQTFVSINAKPIAVTWKQEGSRLVTSIPRPRGLRGPWVVRVEVKNQQGEQIGRDFLEIAPTEVPRQRISQR